MLPIFRELLDRCILFLSRVCLQFRRGEEASRTTPQTHILFTFVRASQRRVSRRYCLPRCPGHIPVCVCCETVGFLTARTRRRHCTPRRCSEAWRPTCRPSLPCRPPRLPRLGCLLEHSLVESCCWKSCRNSICSCGDPFFFFCVFMLV